MVYTSSQAPTNTPLWGFAYDTNMSKETMATRRTPILGMIKEHNHRYYFYEFKINGKDLKLSSRVNTWSRHYADTKEEAIVAYNELVNYHIQKAEKLIEQYSKDIL